MIQYVFRVWSTYRKSLDNYKKEKGKNFYTNGVDNDKCNHTHNRDNIKRNIDNDDNNSKNNSYNVKRKK